MKKTTLLFLTSFLLFCSFLNAQRVTNQKTKFELQKTKVDSTKFYSQTKAPLTILNTGCSNIDFSSNTEDWTYHWSKENQSYNTRPSNNTLSLPYIGSSYGSSSPIINDNLSESRFEVISASTLDTRLGQNINPSASMDDKVLLLGRTDEVPSSTTDEGQYARSGQEEVSKKFTVSNDNAVLQYGYAVVFEMPTHTDVPNTFEVFIEVNNQPLSGCEVIRYTYNNSSENGFVPSAVNPTEDIVKRWTTNTIDLLSHPNINLGDEITISFRNRDCGRNGHGSYAYVSAQCLTKDEGILINPDNDSNCIDEPIIFSANTDVTNPQDLEWTITLGTSTIATYSGSDTITHTFATPGNYLVSLNVTTVNGCTLTYSRNILINECDPCIDPCGMDPDFTYLSAPNQCNVLLTGINNGDICPEQTFEWTVNDVVVGNTQNLNFTFPGTGIYDVCFSITGIPTGGQKDCKITKCKKVTIDCDVQDCPNPCGMIPKFIYKETIKDCTLQLIGFNDGASCPEQTFEWTINGEVVSNLETFIYNFPGTGNYDICYSIIGVPTDGSKDCKETYCKTIFVTCDTDPNDCGNPCGMLPDYTYLNASGQCNYFFNGTNNGDVCPEQTFEWTVNDVVVGNTEDLNFSFPSNGIYNVCFAIIYTPTDGQKDCRIEECKTITVNCGSQGCDNPCGMQSDFAYATNKCNVNFSGINNGDVCNTQTFEWTVNGNVVSTTEDFSFTFPTSGTYDVCFTIYGNTGQKPCESKICKQVTVNCGTVNNDCPDSDCLFIYPHAASNGFCGDTAAILYCVNDEDIQQIEWRYRVGGLDKLIITEVSAPFNGKFIPIYFNEPGDWDGYQFWVDAIITYKNGDVCDVSNVRVMDCDNSGGGQKITLFPNPSKSNSQLSFNGIDYSRVKTIQIIDMVGNIKSNVTPRDKELNIGNLKSGIYFIKFIIDNGSIVQKKLVIE